MPHHSLTRDSLYAEVWAEPISKVAVRYGLSDRGLAKLCERHGIPVPGRGYWAKKAHGHRAKQVPLPPATDARLERIIIEKRPQAPPKPTSEPLIPELAFEQQPENFIIVPERLGTVHPLVAKTRAALAECKPGDRGLLFPPAGALDVRVSPPQVSRALRIIEALVTALEGRGYKVSATDPPGHQTGFRPAASAVTMLGEQVSFGLMERGERVMPPPPTKPPRYSWEASRPFRVVPSGCLRLFVGRSEYPDGKIEDRPSGGIEGRLNSFVALLVRQALRQTDWRRERERAERERAERERLAAERERLRREEEARIKALAARLDAWTQAKTLGAFLEEMEDRPDVMAQAGAGPWFQWARKRLAELGRFATKPHSAP